MPEASTQEERILILAPTGRDAALASRLLDQAGLPCVVCLDEAALFQEIEAGADAILLAEEALQPWTVNALIDLLGRQEPWSDLPLIVFTRGGEASEVVLAALGPLTNAT